MIICMKKSAQHSVVCSFKSSDHDAGDFDNNIDTDNNVYNDIESKCKYYTDNQFDTNMQDIGLLGLSIIHFNARSLNAIFVKMYDYLIGLSLNFDVIAIYETWIQSDSITAFQINGYELLVLGEKQKVVVVLSCMSSRIYNANCYLKTISIN